MTEEEPNKLDSTSTGRETEVPPVKGVKETALDLIKQSTAAAERLEAANKKHEELIEAEAKLKLEKTFDGQADAGKGKKEETDADYAKKVLANEVETKRET